MLRSDYHQNSLILHISTLWIQYNYGKINVHIFIPWSLNTDTDTHRHTQTHTHTHTHTHTLYPRNIDYTHENFCMTANIISDLRKGLITQWPQTQWFWTQNIVDLCKKLARKLLNTHTLYIFLSLFIKQR